MLLVDNTPRQAGPALSSDRESGVVGVTTMTLGYVSLEFGYSHAHAFLHLKRFLEAQGLKLQ